MADGSRIFERLAKSPHGQGRVRRRHVDTGLSLFESDGEGDVGDTDLWAQGLFVEARPPLRDGDADGAARDRGQDHQHAPASDGGGLRDGDDGGSGHGEAGSLSGSLSPQQIDSSELPYVANRHWLEVGEGTTEPSQNGLRDRDGVLEPVDRLTSLTNKALDILEEGMDQRDADEDVVRMHNSKISAAQIIINTQHKVDETALRRKQSDTLPRLIALIEKHQALLPKQLEP